MANRNKTKGLTVMWPPELHTKLRRLMASLQETTPHSVTQSSALQYAVEAALDKLAPAPTPAPAAHSDAPPFTIWPHGEIK